MNIRHGILFFVLTAMLTATPACFAQSNAKYTPLDEKVREFLAGTDGHWHDLNVPSQDGQMLHDLIIKNNYKNALEIGTSGAGLSISYKIASK